MFPFEIIFFGCSMDTRLPGLDLKNFAAKNNHVFLIKFYCGARTPITSILQELNIFTESLTFISRGSFLFQAAYMNEHVYAIGGQDHKQRILRDVERYSVSRGSWEYSGSLCSARAGLAVCVYENKIWVLGGYCHRSGMVLDIVEAFEEEFGKWVTLILW